MMLLIVMLGFFWVACIALLRFLFGTTLFAIAGGIAIYFPIFTTTKNSCFR